MSHIFAAYLFLCIAIIMFVVGIWSKILWVFYISAAGWICAGLYYIAYANGAVFVDMLGIFCLFAGIGTLLGRYMMGKKPVEPPVPYDRTKDIDDTLQQYRNMRRRRH